jgi:hypothetical protein
LAEIIDLGKKRRERDQTKAAADAAKACESDKDDFCKKAQARLTSRRFLLEKGLRSSMSMIQYAFAAKTLNTEIAAHNAQCPQNPVPPLSLL